MSMMASTQTRDVFSRAHIEIVDGAPASARAAQPLELRIRIRNERGDDLVGAAISIINGAQLVASAIVSPCTEADENEDTPPHLRQTTPDFAFATLAFGAPATCGGHVLSVMFPAQRWNGEQFAQAQIALPLEVAPQTASMAVWDVPSPVVVGAPLRFKVGVRSQDALPLAGARIVVLDGDAPVSEGVLGEQPWGGTTALYWTEIEAAAPANEGAAEWTVNMADLDSPAPHAGCSAAVGFRVAGRPDTALSIVVTDRAGNPLPEAEILAGCFRGRTGEDGEAVIMTSCGLLDIGVSKDGYVYWTGERCVNGPTRIVIELDGETPDEDPLWI
jgi:hypothetical protein